VAAESCSVTVRLALQKLSDLTVTEDLSDCVTEAVKPGTSYAESLPVASRLPPCWLEWRCHSCQPLLGCRDLQAKHISAWAARYIAGFLILLTPTGAFFSFRFFSISALKILLACELQEWQDCQKAAECNRPCCVAEHWAHWCMNACCRQH